jgi:hypothetical protein
MRILPPLRSALHTKTRESNSDVTRRLAPEHRNRPGEFVATWTHARPAATGSA